jgi:hypothetical protein
MVINVPVLEGAVGILQEVVSAKCPVLVLTSDVVQMQFVLLIQAALDDVPVHLTTLLEILWQNAKLIASMTVEHLVVEKEHSVSMWLVFITANVLWVHPVTRPCSAFKRNADKIVIVHPILIVSSKNAVIYAKSVTSAIPQMKNVKSGIMYWLASVMPLQRDAKVVQFLTQPAKVADQRKSLAALPTQIVHPKKHVATPNVSVLVGILIHVLHQPFVKL